MGVKEWYYAWQQRRHERKIEELKKMMAKEESILEGIKNSGFGIPRLMATKSELTEERKTQAMKTVCDKQKIMQEMHPEDKIAEKESLEPETRLNLVKPKAKKVIDPELFVTSFDASAGEVDLADSGVESPMTLDTRDPRILFSVNGNYDTGITKRLRLGKEREEVASASDVDKAYALLYGADGEVGKPIEYLEITRGDGSQFYLAERFFENSVAAQNHLREYSIKQYDQKRKAFREDIIFSEGIDMAAVMGNDENYIAALGNHLLGAERLQAAVEREGRVGMSHGSGYVGSLFYDQDEKDYQKMSNKAVNYGALQNARKTDSRYQTHYGETCERKEIMQRMHPEDYKRLPKKEKKFDIKNEKKEEQSH